jgi:hypothetical protein
MLCYVEKVEEVDMNMVVMLEGLVAVTRAEAGLPAVTPQTTIMAGAEHNMPGEQLVLKHMVLRLEEQAHLDLGAPRITILAGGAGGGDGTAAGGALSLQMAGAPATSRPLSH